MNRVRLTVDAVDREGLRHRYVYTPEDTPEARAAAKLKIAYLLDFFGRTELSRTWESLPPEVPW